MTMLIVMPVSTFLVGTVAGYGYAQMERRRKLRPRAVALPGMSQEEHETKEFIAAMHDETSDDVRLQQWKTKQDRRNEPVVKEPIAIASTPHHLATHGMHRIRLFMEDRTPVPRRN